jgi:hypothetical protein
MREDAVVCERKWSTVSSKHEVLKKFRHFTDWRRRDTLVFAYGKRAWGFEKVGNDKTISRYASVPIKSVPTLKQVIGLSAHRHIDMDF